MFCGSATLFERADRKVGAAHTGGGARALLIHAKDDNAKGFYQHFDFEPSASDPLHLLLIMKDLLRIVGK